MSADELFEELGWNCKEKYKNGVSFYDNENNEISITKYADIGIRIEIDKFEGITVEELQAINKKCQELGWLE